MKIFKLPTITYSETTKIWHFDINHNQEILFSNRYQRFVNHIHSLDASCSDTKILHLHINHIHDIQFPNTHKRFVNHVNSLDIPIVPIVIMKLLST